MSPITVYKNFSDHVYWEIPERIAWGLWACENGIAVSWVCSMLYEQFMTKDCTLLFAGPKKLKFALKLAFHPDKTPHNLAVVPAGTPLVTEYASAFGTLSDALTLVEGLWVCMLATVSPCFPCLATL